MWVNAFWMGVLLTLVLEVIAAIIFSIVSNHRQEEEVEVSTEEYKKILEDMTGQKFKVKVVNGYLVGEPVEDVEDKDDETEN